QRLHGAVSDCYYQGWMRLVLILAAAAALYAQSGENVVLVVNEKDPSSAEVAEYYRTRRSVPVRNVCRIATTTEEEIGWAGYEREVEKPVGDCLKKNALQEKILYIVTTLGVPLKVSGAGSGVTAEYASVDSELTLLYAKLKGAHYQRMGPLTNPFFMKRDEPF